MAKKKQEPPVSLEDLLTILSGSCPMGWTVTVVREGQETVTRVATGSPEDFYA